MHWILCGDWREGLVGMTWDYEMNVAFQHPHLPSRTEFVQIPTSPTPLTLLSFLPQLRILITQQSLHYLNSTGFQIQGYVLLLPNVIMLSNINRHTIGKIPYLPVPGDT